MSRLAKTSCITQSARLIPVVTFRLMILALVLSGCGGTSVSSLSTSSTTVSRSAGASSLSSARSSLAATSSSLQAGSLSSSSVSSSNLRSSSVRSSSTQAASASSLAPSLEGKTAYEHYFRPILAGRACIYCHADGTPLEQSPLFMHSDFQFAENELLSTGKVNFLEPSASRIVQKIESFPLHNCGNSIDECRELAKLMTGGITAWAANNNASTLFAKSTIESRPVKASEARAPAQNLRKRDALIAEYTFSDCENDEVADVSGVSPLASLYLHAGAKCIPGAGLYLPERGYAVAPTLVKDKFYPRAVYNPTTPASQAFTLEAWLRPMDNGTPIAFSKAEQNSVRHSLLMTMHAENQEVSITRASNIIRTGHNRFKPGKTIHILLSSKGLGDTAFYINGEQVLGAELDGFSILGFSDEAALWLGGIKATAREMPFNTWEGTIGYLALHNRALSADEATLHASVTPTTKHHIFFDIANLTQVAQTYIRFELDVVEGQVYNFSKPTLITPRPLNIPIEGLQLTINGRSEPLGQSFSDLKGMLVGNEQLLSSLNSTLLPVEKGIDGDTFSITFEAFGDNVFARPVLNYPRPSFKNVPSVEPQGLKIYNRLYATFADLTGVSVSDAELQKHFEVAFESMPTGNVFNSLTPTQMISTANLANLFCTKMMANEASRRRVYPTVQFNAPVTGANLNSLISEAYRHFTRGRSDLIPLDDVKQALTPMVDVMNNAGRSTDAIATAVCSNILSSPIGITY